MYCRPTTLHNFTYCVLLLLIGLIPESTHFNLTLGVLTDTKVDSINLNSKILHKCMYEIMRTFEQYEISKSTNRNPDLLLNEQTKFKNNIFFNKV